MKKILAFSMVLLLALLMTVAVTADPGAFISSPSGNSAPTLIDFSNESDACTAEIKICAYSDRDTLDDAARAKLEEAYASIVGTTDLGSLNSALKDLAEKLQISSDQLAVSDLFDISYVDCDAHTDHGEFTITLKPTVLENYACLLHYNGSAWELVEYSEVSEDGAHLTFVTDDLSPFAIVVHDGTAVLPVDDDGNQTAVIVLGAVAVLGAAATVASTVMVRIFYKKRKL